MVGGRGAGEGGGGWGRRLLKQKMTKGSDNDKKTIISFKKKRRIRRPGPQTPDPDPVGTSDLDPAATTRPGFSHLPRTPNPRPGPWTPDSTPHPAPVCKYKHRLSVIYIACTLEHWRGRAQPMQAALNLRTMAIVRPLMVYESITKPRSCRNDKLMIIL